MRRPLVVALILAVVAGILYLVIFVFDVFEDDPDESVVLDAARYCQLALELEAASLSTGAASSPDVYDGTAEEFQALLDQIGGTLEELRAIAPEEIRADVAAVIDAVRQAAEGDPAAVEDAGFAEIAVRSATHRTSNCVSGSGSGDG